MSQAPCADSYLQLIIWISLVSDVIICVSWVMSAMSVMSVTPAAWIVSVVQFLLFELSLFWMRVFPASFFPVIRILRAIYDAGSQGCRPSTFTSDSLMIQAQSASSFRCKLNLHVDDEVSSAYTLIMMHVQVEIRSSTSSLNWIVWWSTFSLHHHECTGLDCVMNVQIEVESLSMWRFRLHSHQHWGWTWLHHLTCESTFFVSTICFLWVRKECQSIYLKR